MLPIGGWAGGSSPGASGEASPGVTAVGHGRAAEDCTQGCTGKGRSTAAGNSAAGRVAIGKGLAVVGRGSPSARGAEAPGSGPAAPGKDSVANSWGLNLRIVGTTGRAEMAGGRAGARSGLEHGATFNGGRTESASLVAGSDVLPYLADPSKSLFERACTSPEPAHSDARLKQA